VDRSAISKMHIGLSMMFYGIILTFLAILVILIAMAFDTSRAGAETAFLLLSVGMIMVIVSQVLSILGPICCLGAPEDMPGKGLLYVSVIFQLISVGMSLTQGFFVPNLPQGVAYAGMLLGFIAVALFIAFLRRVGEYIGNPGLSRRASETLNTLIVAVVLCALVAVCVAVCLVANQPALGFVGSVIGLVVLGTAIVFLVRYIDLLARGKNTLGRLAASGPTDI
jgi:hypothetical protein